MAHYQIILQSKPTVRFETLINSLKKGMIPLEINTNCESKDYYQRSGDNHIFNYHLFPSDILISLMGKRCDVQLKGTNIYFIDLMSDSMCGLRVSEGEGTPFQTPSNGIYVKETGKIYETITDAIAGTTKDECIDLSNYNFYKIQIINSINDFISENSRKLSTKWDPIMESDEFMTTNYQFFKKQIDEYRHQINENQEHTIALMKSNKIAELLPGTLFADQYIKSGNQWIEKQFIMVVKSSIMTISPVPNNQNLHLAKIDLISQQSIIVDVNSLK